MLRKQEKRLVLYPTDILALLLNTLFGVFSLLNLGKATVQLLGLTADRELLMGLLFLLLNPLQLVFIRFMNPVRHRGAQFFRLFYVQALYMLYFGECIRLSQLFFDGRSLDRFFADLEYVIFRYQPAIEFSQRLDKNPYLNELFFFSYFYYYALVTSGSWFLYIRQRYEEAVSTLFTVSAAFFILYTWYVFFPVQGPKYFFAGLHQRWYSNFDGFFFTNLMRLIFSSMILAGAAFPSSHVALALISLILNWRYNRFIIPVYLPLTILLFISTIYLYAHYVVDIAAGFLAGLILYFFVPGLVGPMERMSARAGRFLADKLRFREIALRVVPPLRSGGPST